MQSQFDFDSIPDRTGTGSLKWQKYAGSDILPMWVADMDFPSAPAIRQALAKRVEHGVYGYTVPYASVEDAVLDYLQQEHGLKVKREWLVWMPGLVPALNTASRAYEKPGDAVMTNTPVYPPFLTAPEWQDKELQAVPLMVKEDRYTFDFEAMEAAVGRKTKLFILCNPHNPVGRAWTLEELRQVVDFCKRHNLIVVSDEIHCDLLLDDGVQHHSFLNVDPWAYDNSLTLMAPSKTYNVPGLGCSYIIIPHPRLRTRFQRASRGMITEVNCFGYVGCEAAYREGGPWLKEVRGVLRGNYLRAYDFIRERMPKLHMFPMEATYLAWIDVRKLNLDHPAAFFEEHGVGLSNGALFGSPGYLRLNFACPREMLDCALERMERAYRTLAG
ncbi:MAG: MalY/PatB family protein [Opitutales bacterium]|jgi:cystathionine beta-lyase